MAVIRKNTRLIRCNILDSTPISRTVVIALWI